MHSRDRVTMALNHREPDKIPVDLATTTVTSITYPAYEQLRSFLGFPPVEPKIAHIHQGVVHPDEDLLRRYEVDFRPVTMRKSPRGHMAEKLTEDEFRDEHGIIWRRAGYDYAPVSSPLGDATVEDLEGSTWPDPRDPARVEGLREEAREVFQSTDFAVVADIMCRGPFEQAVKLRGFEQFLTDMYLDPRFTEALLDKITGEIIALWDSYLGSVGDYVQVVCQGDDLGMQTGLIISPNDYRKYIKPCHQKIFRFIHAKAKAKLFLHSCGGIYDIIPDLIETGVDILNPIQRNAAKMDIAALKRDFGRDLCFWGGGIDVQQFLPHAAPGEIEDEIKRSLDVLAPGGGYVFAFTHNIQPDTSPDRVDTAYRAALAHRSYPIE